VPCIALTVTFSESLAFGRGPGRSKFNDLASAIGAAHARPRGGPLSEQIAMLSDPAGSRARRSAKSPFVDVWPTHLSGQGYSFSHDAELEVSP